MSFEEAEDVAVEIIARCFCLHVYVRKDVKEWLANTMERIGKRADEFSQEHSFEISAASAFIEK